MSDHTNSYDDKSIVSFGSSLNSTKDSAPIEFDDITLNSRGLTLNSVDNTTNASIEHSVLFDFDSKTLNSGIFTLNSNEISLNSDELKSFSGDKYKTTTSTEDIASFEADNITLNIRDTTLNTHAANIPLSTNILPHVTNSTFSGVSIITNNTEQPYSSNSHIVDKSPHVDTTPHLVHIQPHIVHKSSTIGSLIADTLPPIFSNSLPSNPTNHTKSILTIPKFTPSYAIEKKKVIIDVAVLCQEYTNVETICNDNIVNLDEIPITKEVFQAIFYPYKDNFGMNKDFMHNNPELIPLISFLPEHRHLNNNKKFYLVEELIANIERNLNISRNCFTKESLVELTNEIIGIKSLLNINCCSVLASLSWQNVLEVIENYKLINCDHDKSLKEEDNVIIPICVVNIVFKTPTPDVKNTVIRFNYKIIDY